MGTADLIMGILLIVSGISEFLAAIFLIVFSGIRRAVAFSREQRRLLEKKERAKIWS